MTEIRCYGCGAIIQSADTKKPGYVPESALSKEKRLQNDQDIATIKYLGITYMQGRGVASIEVLDV